MFCGVFSPCRTVITCRTFVRGFQGSRGGSAEVTFRTFFTTFLEIVWVKEGLISSIDSFDSKLSTSKIERNCKEFKRVIGVQEISLKHKEILRLYVGK